MLQQRTVRRYEEIVSSQGMSETQVVASKRKFGSVRDEFTGKPDLVLRRAEGLVIIDYKSGELPDDVQEREKRIASWRQQILFYASIVKKEFGEWPVGGEIRLLNKEVIHIPIDLQKAKALLEEAQTLREDYNTKIEAGVPPSELAQYSVEDCIFCEFKGVCDTFWENNPSPIPGADDYGCLSGQVLKVTTGKSRNSSIIIESERSDGNSQKWQISNLSADQFGNLEKLKQGTLVRLLNF